MKKFQSFGKFSDFLKVFRFFESFCDLRLDTWDTDYIFDNWEQQYEQLHCDLWIQSDGDSIRNSCDVLFKNGDWTLIEQFEMLFTASGKKYHWKWIFVQSGEIKAIVGLEARKLMRKCTFWDLASNTYNTTNQTNII